MKRVLLMFAGVLTLGFSTVSCGPQGKGAVTEQPGGELPLQEFHQTLISSGWCPADGDHDGVVGSYEFKSDGNVRYVAWKPATGQTVAGSVMKWSMNDSFLQMGAQIGTREGQRLSFQRMAIGSVKMTWTTVSADKDADGIVSYVASPCSFPEHKSAK